MFSWIEDFAYADGDLVGQGNWITSDIGVQSPAVAADLMETQVIDVNDAMNEVDLAELDFDQDWSFTWSFDYADTNPIGQGVQAIIGELADEFVAITLADANGNGNPAGTVVSAQDAHGATDSVGGFTIPIGPNILEIRKTGTLVQAILNGTPLAAITLTFPLTPSVPAIRITLTSPPGASSSRTDQLKMIGVPL